MQPLPPRLLGLSLLVGLIILLFPLAPHGCPQLPATTTWAPRPAPSRPVLTLDLGLWLVPPGPGSSRPPADSQASPGPGPSAIISPGCSFDGDSTGAPESRAVSEKDPVSSQSVVLSLLVWFLPSPRFNYRSPPLSPFLSKSPST